MNDDIRHTIRIHERLEIAYDIILTAAVMSRDPALNVLCDDLNRIVTRLRESTPDDA